MIYREQASSLADFMRSASVREKMRILMEAGDVADDNSKKPFRLKTKEEKLDMVKDVLELVNQGQSWHQAAGEKGRGYTPDGVVFLAKQFGLYKPSQTAKNKAKVRAKVDKKMPLILKRRADGLTVRESIKGTGVTMDQYYRALERLKAGT